MSITGQNSPAGPDRPSTRRIRVLAVTGLVLLPVAFALSALLWLYCADQYAHAGADWTPHWPAGLALFAASGSLGLLALFLPRKPLIWMQFVLLIPAVVLFSVV